MSKHKVIAERSGEWWNLVFPDDEFVYSQTKRLDRASDAARSALAAKYDVTPDSIEVSIEVRVPEEFAALVEELRELNRRVEANQRAFADAQRRLVDAMVRKRYSMRDIGQMIERSPQRIAQLTKTR